MRHPFAKPTLVPLHPKALSRVHGGLSPSQEYDSSTQPNDGKSRALKRQPISPPIFFTQALGEDGGYMPDYS
ncbi:hypothetical protein [Alteromonas facilis]|uniref:hypothetical protein n=1 Tax=Alteromonas facilis TaxID=2048004 RepID=UPI000C292C22|nr:hypothetical protein [Alteromonas facilis]